MHDPGAEALIAKAQIWAAQKDPLLSGGPIQELRFHFDRDAGAIDTDAMENVSRSELNAKLETIEAKMDGRLALIEAGFVGMRDQMSAMREDMAGLRSDGKNLKYWLMGTGIAIVLGIAAFNATVLSNMVASFESGKNTSAAQVQVQQQVKDTQQLLDEVKKQMAEAQAQKASAAK